MAYSRGNAISRTPKQLKLHMYIWTTTHYVYKYIHANSSK